MKLTVVHLEGSKQGQTEYIPGPVVTAGRDPSNQLAFDPFKDLDVSTRHASITFQGEQVMLQDLGSKNGTFLNGAKVNGAVPLPQDAIVQFGEKGPKVKLTYIFHTGPGKKTQMIQDLAGKLDAAEAEKAKAKSKSTMLACCFFFVLLLGGGAWFGWSIYKGKKDARLAMEQARPDATKSREKATTAGADKEPAAKADWDKAMAALTAAEAAEKADDPVTARAKYVEAAKAFEDAQDAAQAALLKKFESEKGAGAAVNAEAEKKRLEELEKAKKEIEEQRRKDKEALEALVRALQDQQKLLATLDKIKDSTKPDELKGAVDALEAAVKANPNDPALKEKLEQFKQKLSRIQNMDDLLRKAAADAKAATVAIRSKVWAIPAGQRPDTTKIRIEVASGAGTGFFIAEGKIATTKEVVEPHLFQPGALALHVKLNEKGMKLFTDLEVMTYKAGEGTAGIYTTTYTSPAVTVARRYEDSFSPAQPQKIKYDNAEVEVQIKPHRKDEGDLVVLKVEGATGHKVLDLGTGDPTADTPIIALGTMTGDKELGLEPGQVGLFQFLGKVTGGATRLDLAVPSYPQWIGGPVLNADGKVVAIIVDAGTDKSKAVSASILKRD
jgi:S1-C subfamily serine protease